MAPAILWVSNNLYVIPVPGEARRKININPEMVEFEEDGTFSVPSETKRDVFYSVSIELRTCTTCPQGMLKGPCKHRTSHITSWSKFSFKISTIPEHQNLNQTSASKSWPNFNFKKFTEVQPQSLKQKYTSKSWSNFSFKTLTISRPQSLDQNQGSNSLPNLSFKILTKLSPTQYQHQQH